MESVFYRFLLKILNVVVRLCAFWILTLIFDLTFYYLKILYFFIRWSFVGECEYEKFLGIFLKQLLIMIFIEHKVISYAIFILLFKDNCIVFVFTWEPSGDWGGGGNSSKKQLPNGRKIHVIFNFLLESNCKYLNFLQI